MKRFHWINTKARRKHLRQSFTTSLILTALTTLTACGGSSSSDSSDPTQPPEQPSTTTFSLAVSDAPVDNASEVVVYFDEVELIGNGEPLTFSVEDENGDPRSIDLLALPGAQFEVIVEDTSIPVGDYNQIRLSVTDDSYIVMDEGTYPIRVPSGELKLDGFTAQPNFDAAYTIEFDLRKSLVDPVGQPLIMLKPRGVRLVLNDDADEGVDDTEIRPFTVVPVTYNDTEETFEFTAGFVPQGDYTLSFSCAAFWDEPETDEDEFDGFFLQTLDTTEIIAGDTTQVNIIE